MQIIDNSALWNTPMHINAEGLTWFQYNAAVSVSVGSHCGENTTERCRGTC